MFEPTVRDGALRVRAVGARWLSTGFGGGFSGADAAYNLTVPEGFSRTDLEDYVVDRRRAAGFDEPGPALLTGVSQEHARGARSGSVVAYATAGLSNPAALPADPDVEPDPHDLGGTRRHDGTVNIVLGTTRALDDGALAALLATAVEAKAATLLAGAGVPGTTTDAVVVGCDPSGEPAAFAGSGTAIGADARACVREAVRASLDSRDADEDDSGAVAGDEDGVRTDRRADVFRP